MMDQKVWALSIVACVAMIAISYIEGQALATGEDGAYMAPYMTALGAIVGAVGGYIYGKKSASEL